MTPPRRVLNTAAELAGAVRELADGGWRVHRGFGLPDEPWELAGSRLVLAGELATEADARAALLGAVRGAGLAVRLDRARPWAAGFLADLARLAGPDSRPLGTPAGRTPGAATERPAGAGIRGPAGPVAGGPARSVATGPGGTGAGGPAGSVAGGSPGPPAGGPGGAVPLTVEQRQILDLLADGASIAQAARRLFLSLRTANRRVAAARNALGVTSTREAVLAYLRLRGGPPAG